MYDPYKPYAGCLCIGGDTPRLHRADPPRLSPGTLTRYGPSLRRPVGPLHWAGTETATRWAGYIDGAVESGHRTAAEAARRPAG